MVKKAIVVSIFLLSVYPLHIFGGDPGTARWSTTIGGAVPAAIVIGADGTIYTGQRQLCALSADAVCGATFADDSVIFSDGSETGVLELECCGRRAVMTGRFRRLSSDIGRMP